MLIKNPKSNVNRVRRWTRPTSSGIGIDIGQFSTKVVWVEDGQGQGLQVAAATLPSFPQPTSLPDTDVQAIGLGSEHLPPGRPLPRDKRLVPDSPAQRSRTTAMRWSQVELQRLMQQIAQLLGSARRFRHAHVSLALSMSACDYRSIYLPKDTRVTLAAIQQTIAQATGEQAARCVAILPGSEQSPLADKQSFDKQSRIRCLSVREDLALSVAQQLDEIGLTPRRIDGLPWCLANALELVVNTADPQKITLAMDWSFGQPTLVSVRDGTINYVRCLSSGGIQELVSQIIAELQLTVPEAVRWIRHCLSTTAGSPADASIVETQDWIAQCCTKLATEINVALDFIRWRNQGCQIEALWLMGGGAQLPGLKALLENQLAAEVRTWKFQAINQELTADYATAIALSLQGARHA